VVFLPFFVESVTSAKRFRGFGRQSRECAQEGEGTSIGGALVAPVGSAGSLRVLICPSGGRHGLLSSRPCKNISLFRISDFRYVSRHPASLLGGAYRGRHDT
jgi:hypothetical protein